MTDNFDDLESPSRSFLLQAFQVWFLRMQRYASPLFTVIASLSDHPSFVTSWCTTKMAKCRISESDAAR